MWTKCPDCQKKKNYVPVLSLFVKGKSKQCPECKRLEKLEQQRWEDEGGATIDREVETQAGYHIYRQPHFQDSHM